MKPMVPVKHMQMTAYTIQTLSQDDRPSERIIQKTTSCTCSALPTYCGKEVMAEKRYLIASPAKKMVSRVLPLYLA
jgi:hypothetical protein